MNKGLQGGDKKAGLSVEKDVRRSQGGIVHKKVEFVNKYWRIFYGDRGLVNGDRRICKCGLDARTPYPLVKIN